MTETENQDVTQDVVAPAVEDVSQAHEQPVEQEGVNQPQEGTDQSQTDKDYNFKALRESNARLQAQFEEERRQREHLQTAIEEKFAAHLQPQQKEEQDELADVAKDDWVSREQSEKLADRRAKAIVKQMLSEDRQSRMKEELPTRVKAKHSDFESVVTKENVEYLKANKPHIAASLAATTDPYAQAMSAYDAIKAFCPTLQIKDEENRMNKHALTPGTLGAAQAPSPLSEAKALERGLTPELKRKYQQEMIQAMRGN